MKEAKKIDSLLNSSSKNYLFIGEAGSGKSEIAVNLAKYLRENSGRQVHFFDLDMTKPLFRSRDVRTELEAMGVLFHHEKQFMDAPTLVGGVRLYLKNPDTVVILDVGGDYIGARAIGGLAPVIKQTECMVFYVINPYRPWSLDIEHIDQVLGAVLGVSHISVEHLQIISNPNIGTDTKIEDVVEGHRRLAEMLKPYKDIAFACARKELCVALKKCLALPVMPLHLYLNYPWQVERSESDDLGGSAVG